MREVKTWRQGAACGTLPYHSTGMRCAAASAGISSSTSIRAFLDKAKCENVLVTCVQSGLRQAAPCPAAAAAVRGQCCQQRYPQQPPLCVNPGAEGMRWGGGRRLSHPCPQTPPRRLIAGANQGCRDCVPCSQVHLPALPRHPAAGQKQRPHNKRCVDGA